MDIGGKGSCTHCAPPSQGQRPQVEGKMRPGPKERNEKALDVRGNGGPEGEELRREPALQRKQEEARSREGRGLGHQDIKPLSNWAVAEVKGGC